jgi:hypothetical protein
MTTGNTLRISKIRRICEYDCKILSAHIFDDDGKYVKDIEDKEDLRIELNDAFERLDI